MAMKIEIEEKQIEAPYELPEGWKWYRLGDFINIFRGVSYKKNDAHNEKQENDCLIIRGGNIDEGCINLNSDNVFVNKSLVSENQIIKKNDVIIVTSTGSIKVIGRAGVSASDYEDVAFGAFLTLARPNEKANKSFVNQYFQSSLYRERIRRLASGVNINNIRIEYITESPFPLPPTPDEQQRIVNRIESMFAKLDEAKEKAQNVVDGFETRKAAILHKTFTNQLKIENGKLKDEDWEERKLGEICEVTSSKRVYQTEQTSSGIPFLRIADIMCKIQNKDVFPELFISAERYKKLQSQNLVPKENEILVTSRGTLGKCYLIKKDDMFYFQDGMISWLKNIDRNISSQYLIYLFQSKEITNQIEEMQNGSTVNYLSISMLKKISIPIPPFNFQLSIVNFLDSVLEKENKAKQAAETVLEQIDLLKKSILARAFRGEL